MILIFFATRQMTTKGMAEGIKSFIVWAYKFRIQTIDHDLNTFNPLRSNFCWV